MQGLIVPAPNDDCKIGFNCTTWLHSKDIPFFEPFFVRIASKVPIRDHKTYTYVQNILNIGVKKVEFNAHLKPFEKVEKANQQVFIT